MHLFSPLVRNMTVIHVGKLSSCPIVSSPQMLTPELQCCSNWNLAWRKTKLQDYKKAFLRSRTLFPEFSKHLLAKILPAVVKALILVNAMIRFLLSNDAISLCITLYEIPGWVFEFANREVRYIVTAPYLKTRYLIMLNGTQCRIWRFTQSIRPTWHLSRNMVYIVKILSYLTMRLENSNSWKIWREIHKLQSDRQSWEQTVQLAIN